MKAQPWTILILLALVPTAHTVERVCRPGTLSVELQKLVKEGAFGIHHGTEVKHALDSRIGIPEGSRVFRLGEGDWAAVYRVVRPDESSIVLKIYKERNPAAIDREVAAYRYLESLQSRVRSTDFAVARVLSRGDFWLELADTRGMPLDKLLRDPKLNPALKRELVARYGRLKRELLERMREGGNEIFPENAPTNSAIAPGLDPALFTVELPDGTSHMLSIKPENLVVDPVSLKLTSIDPL